MNYTVMHGSTNINVLLKLARDAFHRRLLGKVMASCPGENINWLEVQRQFTLFI